MGRCVWERDVVQVALALYPGVSAHECEAFTLVFDQLADAQLVRVGARLGRVDGPGGGNHIDALFDQVTQPDVVLVPGGLGCARAAGDVELLHWIRRVGRRCDWLAASSTGTVIVAAAGLLHEHEVATHWLASELLESYGSTASHERIVQVDNVITCEGAITAMHVALLVTLRLAGPDAVARARAGIEREQRSSQPRTKRWNRLRSRPTRPAAPRNPELVAPDVIELEPFTVHPY